MVPPACAAAYERAGDTDGDADNCHQATTTTTTTIYNTEYFFCLAWSYFAKFPCNSSLGTGRRATFSQEVGVVRPVGSHAGDAPRTSPHHGGARHEGRERRG